MELSRHADGSAVRPNMIVLHDSMTSNKNLIELHYRITYFYVTWSHQTLINGQSCLMQLQLLQANIIHSMRLRGGTNPNLRKEHYDIPSLTKQRFMWNGLRDIDFVEKIMFPLRNGLGQTSFKDASLLDCAERTDPGGILGNPPRAAAPQNVIDISIRRSIILFSCIMQYILPSSRVYKMFMTQFPGRGIDIFWWMVAHGPINKPPRVLKAQEDVWIRMTMESLKLEYSCHGYLLWIECVLEQARILAKNGQQIKTKMIDGLPTFFNTEKAHMRHNIAFVYPATFGGIPEYAVTAAAGIVHPMAGQQHGEALLLSYVPDFMAKCSETRNLPKGLVREIIAMPENDQLDGIDGEDEKESVQLAAADVTEATKCYLCGGDSHAATQTGPDGETILCAKKALQDMGIIDKQAKSTSFKPKRPFIKPSTKSAKIAELQSQVKELVRHIQSTTIQSEPETSEAEYTEDQDEGTEYSDDSDASNLSSFDASAYANQLARKGGKRPMLKKGKPVRK